MQTSVLFLALVATALAQQRILNNRHGSGWYSSGNNYGSSGSYGGGGSSGSYCCGGGSSGSYGGGGGSSGSYGGGFGSSGSGGGSSSGGVLVTGLISGFVTGVRPTSGGFNTGGNYGSVNYGSGGFGSGGYGSGNLVSGGSGSGGYGGGSSSSCRYWCRSGNNQFYCCENSSQTTSNIAVHPGSCPAVRPLCPGTRGLPPKTCSNDGSCGWADKCCFDSCLKLHVCKPALKWMNASIGLGFARDLDALPVVQ
ncbi:keratin, type I cytoskeletal 9-like [Penaeus indicus]|uniref:keratin, type I cytoskeletal 9-like n=1 Tax=Penaeus indicus TaxID=29960 RepID=UPI00300CE300